MRNLIMENKRDMREMTMEDLFAAGVSPVEMHKLIEKMQEEQRQAERIKAAKQKKEIAAAAALQRLEVAFKDYMITVGAMDAEEWEEFKVDFMDATQELALNIKLDKKMKEFMKKRA